MATPLKLRDANGNIQEFSTSEENYVAYQIGLHLSDGDSAEVGSLNRLTTGDTVGTFSNTFFNQPVGTHPSTSITTGTTNTTIYQTTGTAAETDSDVFSPLMWVDSASETGFKMMPDVDLNEAIDRYLGTIHTNEYPGSYRLAASAPSGDWTEQQTAFTDTRTDGTSVAYKLWRRTSGTVPTAVRPVRLRNEDTFEGVQEMTDRQIKYSFGQRAKTRLLSSGIGTYELRSATQGAPTSPGTWVARGTATDTKQTTSQQLFTRDSTTNFQANYTKAYTGNFATNYTRLFQATYTSVSESTPYTRAFTTQFLRQDSETFQGQYDKTYLGTYTGDYNKQYIGTYTSNYVNQYTTNFTSVYTKNTQVAYVPNYISNYQANYDADYVGTFTQYYNREYTEQYTGAYDKTYNKHYTGTYTGTYTTNFVRTSQVPYAGNYEALYTPNYVRAYTGGNYLTNYTTAYQTNYTGNSDGKLAFLEPERTVKNGQQIS